MAMVSSSFHICMRSPINFPDLIPAEQRNDRKGLLGSRQQLLKDGALQTKASVDLLT
jgi:hypothetical protein